eukprot:5250489-Alexandrium_andersonii.AAC.1
MTRRAHVARPEPERQPPSDKTAVLELAPDSATGLLADLLGAQLVHDLDDSAGAGLVLPADDLIKNRTYRVPAPAPVEELRTEEQGGRKIWKQSGRRFCAADQERALH